MSVAGNLGRQSFPVPIGSIFLFAGLVGVPSIAPDTYLVCDGSAFDPVRYPLLSVALGGVTLPDLRQKVISGGPVADIGTLVPGQYDPVTTTPVTLTASNIPSLSFNFTTSVTGFVDCIEDGGSGVKPCVIADTPIITGENDPITNNRVPPLPLVPISPVSVTIPDQASWTNPNPVTSVTPTLTISGGQATTLVFRYIIKAGF